MTYGQLFMILNPNVKVVENGTCVWIYFDSANHDTLRVEWWNKEIPDEALKAQGSIIHCKDCKYAKPLNEEYLGCSCLVDGIDSDYVMTVKPDSYCSWADRR